HRSESRTRPSLRRGNTAHGDLEERVSARHAVWSRERHRTGRALRSAAGGGRLRAEQSQKRRVPALTSAAAGERRTSRDSAR
uniref:Uncharacterized protein n=2 Tax=Ixodes scapularis TaxID=6945 RepID=A0A1S4KYY3_IXOSC